MTETTDKQRNADGKAGNVERFVSRKTGKKKRKHRKWFNCLYAGKPFRLTGGTHCHCEHHRYAEMYAMGEYSPWDSLMFIFDSCHEWKPKNKDC